MSSQSDPSIGIIVKSDRSGRTRYTAQYKQEVLSAFESRSLSAPDFAKQCGIKYPTLPAWIAVRKRGGQTPTRVNAPRQAVRAAESNPIHQRLHKVITLLAKRRILPKSKLGKAIYYALRQWPQLELYLTDGRVEIDNNLVENAVRPTKLGAKNWLFLGNAESGTKCAILYTIVEN